MNNNKFTFSELLTLFPKTMEAFTAFLLKSPPIYIYACPLLDDNIEPVDFSSLFILMEFLEENGVYVWVKPYEPEGLFKPNSDYKYGSITFDNTLYTRREALSVAIKSSLNYLEQSKFGEQNGKKDE